MYCQSIGSANKCATTTHEATFRLPAIGGHHMADVERGSQTSEHLRFCQCMSCTCIRRSTSGAPGPPQQSPRRRRSKFPVLARPAPPAHNVGCSGDRSSTVSARAPWQHTLPMKPLKSPWQSEGLCSRRFGGGSKVPTEGFGGRLSRTHSAGSSGAPGSGGWRC